MRICFDIDGTIAELREKGQLYSEVVPKKGAVEKLHKLKEEGHYIILHTARNMETFSGNVGKVISVQGPLLFKWLEKYDIPYDEIYFGKPSADYYVDDKGYRLENWDNLPF
jgi:capsule biosynthesis phosphatase